MTIPHQSTAALALFGIVEHIEKKLGVKCAPEMNKEQVPQPSWSAAFRGVTLVLHPLMIGVQRGSTQCGIYAGRDTAKGKTGRLVWLRTPTHESELLNAVEECVTRLLAMPDRAKPPSTTA